MRTLFFEHIDAIDATAWNALAGTDNPFLRHEFLAALEHHDCVGERYGWLPRHVTLWEGDRLVGASPLYLKDNSYGELVFDWAWASAYERHGLAYYPKLVSAVPYTPATGSRLLVAPDADAARVRTALVMATLAMAADAGLSSMHWLFPTVVEKDLLASHGLMPRVGCQFHWSNAGYGDFDDFLGTLVARKRKNILRERRRVNEAGVKLEVRHGDELSAHEWQIWHALYRATFERKSGLPTLSIGFFEEIGQRLGDQVVLVFARRHGDIIAGAFCLCGGDRLYGRHWGIFEHHDSLHFETCYYQGIDYCIRRGITHFEPGAQGEHKIARGFLPTRTWSAHWIADEGFRDAIGRFLHQESAAMAEYSDELTAQSPYRQDAPPAVGRI